MMFNFGLLLAVVVDKRSQMADAFEIGTVPSSSILADALDGSMCRLCIGLTVFKY